MRVIAGSRKGRVIHPVPGKSTRPTTDKVKESIFNLVGQPYFAGGIGLDLCAGTGGLGIEALSRGMDRMIFVDQNRKAVDIIKQNVQELELAEQCEIYKAEASRALKALIKRELTFDLIFLDPPYANHRLATELAIFNDYKLVSPEGILVVESSKHAELPERVGDIIQFKFQVYGDTEIRLYRRKGEQ